VRRGSPGITSCPIPPLTPFHPPPSFLVRVQAAFGRESLRCVDVSTDGRPDPLASAAAAAAPSRRRWTTGRDSDRARDWRVWEANLSDPYRVRNDRPHACPAAGIGGRMRRSGRSPPVVSVVPVLPDAPHRQGDAMVLGMWLMRSNDNRGVINASRSGRGV
jgi:hypothetical protein